MDGSIEIGLQFSIIDLSPFLKSGMTFAILSLFGAPLKCIALLKPDHPPFDWLINCVIVNHF